MLLVLELEALLEERNKSLQEQITEIKGAINLAKIYEEVEKSSETEEDIDVKKIPKHDIDQYIKLRRQGYIKDHENDQFIAMVHP